MFSAEEGALDIMARGRQGLQLLPVRQRLMLLLPAFP
jgi:hypothetical protein